MSDAETPSAKRLERLVSRDLNGEVLVYDPDTLRAHCLQPLAAAVWRGAQGPIAKDQLRAAVERDLGGPLAEEQFDQAITELTDAGLLPQAEPGSLSTAGLGRREALQQIGVGAAVLGVFVTTILAPSPAQASTCLPSGSACTTSAECCSGLCAGSTCA